MRAYFTTSLALFSLILKGEADDDSSKRPTCTYVHRIVALKLDNESADSVCAPLNGTQVNNDRAISRRLRRAGKLLLDKYADFDLGDFIFFANACTPSVIFFVDAHS